MPASKPQSTPRIDPANQCVWWGDRRVDLTNKSFQVLDYLVQHPDRLLTKTELLDAVWPDTHVGEAVLVVAINQLREALADDRRQPRFIETVHGRGYRWVGPPTPPDIPNSPQSVASIYGRESVLAQLDEALDRARAGRRQMVFVTGEPGIGKTAVLDALAQSPAAQIFDIARGQCVDAYGRGDAYLPLIEALDQLCRRATGVKTVDLLRRLAPSWLLQLPGMMPAREAEELRRSLAGSSAERMTLELLRFVEERSGDRPLLVLLEDLHWSDHPTIAALGALFARREAARVLVVASFRHADAIATLHPVSKLRHELLARRQATEIAIDGLGVDAVARYLDDRFGDHRLPPKLAHQVQAQTAGNPLFLLNAMDLFVQRGWLEERDGHWQCSVDLATLEGAIPEGTRAMLSFRLRQLSPPLLELLEAASVVGTSFSTQALAAAVAGEPAEVEGQCTRLARAAQFLHDGRPVVLPDGSAGMQYPFRHVLYQQVLYADVTPARRQLLHRRVAERLEQALGAEAGASAAQLALHFERGGNAGRAVHYLQSAADLAFSRYAYPEAIAHLRAALRIVPRLPASAERDTRELALHTALIVRPYAWTDLRNPELSQAAARIGALAGPEQPMLVDLQATGALAQFHAVRGELCEARAACERLAERLAARDGHGVPSMIAAGLLGYCEVLQGDLAAAVEHLETASQLVLGEIPIDPTILATANAAFGRCLLGDVRRARELYRTAEARASRHGSMRIFVAGLNIRVGIVLRDDELLRDAIIVLAERREQIDERSAEWLEVAQAWRDRRTDASGVDRLRRLRRRLCDTGILLRQPCFASVEASVLLSHGRAPEAEAVVAEALALSAETGERCWDAELHRLGGDARLAALRRRPGTTKWRATAADAESAYRRALEVARAQGARWWQLRAATSLARLLIDSDRRSEARQLLDAAYVGFGEEPDLPDLRSVREILSTV
jgi:DNA-binding winged helix-turn-helix (wHTH) protein